jgi:hypothetical protein
MGRRNQMIDDGLDIPDFLIRNEPQVRRHRVKYSERILTMPKNHKPQRWLPQSMSSESWILLKQIEKDKERRKAERIATLRELRK